MRSRGAAMMGQQSGIQEQLFFCFSLENHVPKDHLLRGIHRLLDLGDFRQQLASFYSPMARPSIDPELMIRKKKDSLRYRASQYDCLACPLKEHCCPNTLNRKIVRSPFESARDVARAITKTEAYKQSRKERKKVEMLFAHLKRILRLDKLRLRGFTGAQDEFLLAATAQNLRRMAKRLAIKDPIAQVTSPPIS